MLNFETLTGKQHLLPRSQHTKLMQVVSELAPDPDGELKRYYQLTQERVNNVQTEFFTTDKFSAGHNYAGMISDSASRVFFKLHYMYDGLFAADYEAGQGAGHPHNHLRTSSQL